ncbi:MAG: hypothetical protein ABR578_03085 [Chromatocurvus sp.]
MKILRGAGLVAMAAALLLPVANAQNDSGLLETDWLELVRGYQDEESGVQVREVIKDRETGAMQLQIAVPKAAMGEVVEMEEVRVVGQRPEKFEFRKLLPEFEYEWVEDYDNDHYGLLVRFTEKQKTPLRLYFSSETGFIQP